MTITTMAMLGLSATTGVFAQDQPRQTGPDFGKASPVGLIIIVLLLIAVFFLAWSMNRHLRKLPASFTGDADAEATDRSGADGAVIDGPRDADPDLSTDDPADGTKRESG